MSKYSREEFKIDRDRLIAIVGDKLSYCGCDPATYRATFGDDVLGLDFDVYLSRHTVIVRQKYAKPRYYRNQSWEQIAYMFNHIANYLL